MKKILAILAMLFSSLVMVTVVTPPAHAAYITSHPGWCNGTAYMKTNTWGINKNVNWGVLDERYRLAAYAQYWYCPQGSAPNEIRVFGTVFCVTMLSENNWWQEEDQINGFKWNAYYTNANEVVVNPPQLQLGWPNGADQGEQHCQTQDIPWADQRTMMQSSNPFWTLSGWVNINDAPDQEFTFRTNDGYVKRYIEPWNDPYVSLF